MGKRDALVLDTLIKARKKIEKGWNKYFIALSANNDVVDPTSRRAKTFCAKGAIHAVTGHDSILRQVACKELSDSTVVTGKARLEQFNDNPRITKKDVLDLYDDTIARVRNRIRKTYGLSDYGSTAS